MHMQRAFGFLINMQRRALLCILLGNDYMYEGLFFGWPLLPAMRGSKFDHQTQRTQHLTVQDKRVTLYKHQRYCRYGRIGRVGRISAC